MSVQTFWLACGVAALLTALALLWGLNLVKRRSSRLVALQVGAATVAGGVALWLAARVVVAFLDP